MLDSLVNLPNRIHERQRAFQVRHTSPRQPTRPIRIDPPTVGRQASAC